MSFSNQIKVNKNSVDFNYRFDVNKNSVQATPVATIVNNALRIKNINLYPSNPPFDGSSIGAAQRLGEMVFVGGTLTSKLNIIPR